MQQLVPPHILASADKVLFITHFAIGDFTYWQNYFVAFAQQYPHLKIDIWVDEVRRTRCFWRWKALKKYALYDWLEACPWVNMVYRETYSPRALKRTIKYARAQQYPLVISLATLRSHEYVNLARKVSPRGFIAGLTSKPKFFQIGRKLAFKKLNVGVSFNYLSDFLMSWLIIKPERHLFKSLANG